MALINHVRNEMLRQVDDIVVVGRAWPVTLTNVLAAHLNVTVDRSMRHWIATCGARLITVPTAFHNLNTTDDLAHYASVSDIDR